MIRHQALGRWIQNGRVQLNHNAADIYHNIIGAAGWTLALGILLTFSSQVWHELRPSSMPFPDSGQVAVWSEAVDGFYLHGGWEMRRVR